MTDNAALISAMLDEFKRGYKGGVYAKTQYEMAYNSNRIEGSRLTEGQTAYLFTTSLLVGGEEYRAKDVEEATGHFLMFNAMLKGIGDDLSEGMLKEFHGQLKGGVFEDRANGYAIGEYKSRPNMVGGYATARPEETAEKMRELFAWYGGLKVKDMDALCGFHARFESIHPFQDGNGRVGRMALFRESLKSREAPIIVYDEFRGRYIEALIAYREGGDLEKLKAAFRECQKRYSETVDYFYKERALHKKKDGAGEETKNKRRSERRENSKQ